MKTFDMRLLRFKLDGLRFWMTWFSKYQIWFDHMVALLIHGKYYRSRTPPQCKDGLFLYGISMLKIRRSQDRLIFNMGIPILVKWYPYIEMTPGIWLTCSLNSTHCKMDKETRTNLDIARLVVMTLINEAIYSGQCRPDKWNTDLSCIHTFLQFTTEAGHSLPVAGFHQFDGWSLCNGPPVRVGKWSEEIRSCLFDWIL